MFHEYVRLLATPTLSYTGVLHSPPKESTLGQVVSHTSDSSEAQKQRAHKFLHETTQYVVDYS